MKTLILVVLSCILPILAAHAAPPYVLRHPIPMPPDIQIGASLGNSAAYDGNRVVLGASNDDLEANNSGLVKVFDATTGTLQLTIPNPTPASDDNFGFAIALAGNRLIVGASGDSTGASFAGSVYVFDLGSATPTTPVLTINNPSPEVSDRFGIEVALAGNRLIVGAHRDDTGATDAGSVYVYDLASGTPTVPVITIANPDPSVLDLFGRSVAIDGRLLLVAAYLDDTGATDAGSVYVYDLDSGTPNVPVHTLNNPSPAANDQFGLGVTISGQRVVVGAFGDDTSATNAGSIYLYDLGSATPTTPVTISNPLPSPLGQNFGWPVSLVGNRLVVGVTQEATGANGSGAVVIYDVSGASPSLVRTIKNPTPSDQERFGQFVCQQADRLLVTAPLDDVPAESAGAGYLFDLASASPAVPVQRYSDTSGAADNRFGTGAAISGTLVAVSAPGDQVPNFTGTVRIFDLASGTPSVPTLLIQNPSTTAAGYGESLALDGTRLAVSARDFTVSGVFGSGRVVVHDLASATPGTPAITLNNPAPGPSISDNFGIGIAVHGSYVIVSAPGDDTSATDAGSVYVFDMSSGTPTVPVLTLNNTTAGAKFGTSVAMSGTRIIVGAESDSTGATNAGRAFVYDLSGGTPTVAVATLDNPTPVSGERFGYSVTIDGSKIVVGAVSARNVANSINTGAAYVYDLAGASPTTPVHTLYNPNTSASSSFGASVAIRGDRVVVGNTEAYPDPANTGRAHVYDLSSATPLTPIAMLTAPTPGASDHFGTAVGISGDLVLASAPFSDVSGRNQGAVYVFEPPSTNANLSALAMSAGTLSPSFASSTIGYTVNLPGGTTSMTVTPTSANAFATIKVNSSTVTSGNASGSITLSNGANPITIEVTAEDPIATKTYTVNAIVGPTGTLNFSSAVGTVNSSTSVGNIDLTIERTDSTNGPLTCTLNTADGSAISPTHYTAQSNVAVSFANGENSKTVSIAIAANAATTTARAFIATLSNPSAGGSLGSITTKTIVILPPSAATELIKPAAAFTAPLNAATIVDTLPIIVSGTATDNIGVAKVQLALNAGAFSDVAVASPGATNTTFTTNVTPAPGLNTLRVRAVDFKGNVSAIVTRTFTHLRTLAVSVSGPVNSGIVSTGFMPTSNRQVGKSYTIIATPKPGFVFDGWTVNNTTGTGITPLKMELPTLAFIMQPDLTLTAKFIVNPFTAAVTGDFSGLITASASQPSGGTVMSNTTTGLCTVKLTTTGALTGSIRIDGLTLPIVATCDNTGVARFGVTRETTMKLLRPGKPWLVLALTADLSGATNRITGTLTELKLNTIVAQSDIKADRHHFNGTTSIVPAAYVKSYTARLKARTSQGAGFTTHDYPQGDGYLTFKVMANGSVSASGKLADDTPVTFSGNLSQAKHWPIYQALYVNKGCIAADAVLDDTQADTDATAMNMLWFRPFQVIQWYPYGWDEGIYIDMLASKYTPSPATVFPGLAATNPNTGNTALSFTDGLLASSVTKFVNLTTTNVLTKAPTTDTTFTFVPVFTTGLISGTFKHSDNTSPKWQGVLMQKGANKGGHGYFMSSKPAVLNYLGESGAMHWLAK